MKKVTIEFGAFDGMQGDLGVTPEVAFEAHAELINLACADTQDQCNTIVEPWPYEGALCLHGGGRFPRVSL